jgi:hypothetical protein
MWFTLDSLLRPIALLTAVPETPVVPVFEDSDALVEVVVDDPETAVLVDVPVVVIEEAEEAVVIVEVPVVEFEDPEEMWTLPDSSLKR